MRNRRLGFTLIELMIVIAIIVIVIAIATPIYIRQRMVANESATISAMRTLATAEFAFRSSNIKDFNGDGDGDYGTIRELFLVPGPRETAFIDSTLATGERYGYQYQAVITIGSTGGGGEGEDEDEGAESAVPQFQIYAEPIIRNVTGRRAFYVDDSGVIRYENNGSRASRNSTPVG